MTSFKTNWSNKSNSDLRAAIRIYQHTAKTEKCLIEAISYDFTFLMREVEKRGICVGYTRFPVSVADKEDYVRFPSFAIHLPSLQKVGKRKASLVSTRELIILLHRSCVIGNPPVIPVTNSDWIGLPLNHEKAINLRWEIWQEENRLFD